jgi:hypothetical protein
MQQTKVHTTTSNGSKPMKAITQYYPRRSRSREENKDIGYEVRTLKLTLDVG